LSLRIYLDDCANSAELARCLVAAGHQVVTPVQAGLRGRADALHYAYAAAHGLALLTKDPDDFQALHQADPAPQHGGIFGVYQDNDPTRDMTHAEVARAINNLETSGVPTAGQFHVLNAWRY
jgi:hypothetical protein